ncbi:HupE/UreJ family protein [Mesorhizobium sp.]|uniref:HupE/UreJ family protein n=1 Tax=Mesorhizobium sp. TaxID=1871066 RepID=UPI000FE6095D|nr:MAG: HupE/UreJ family protein [Mesorhizobium sp.]
MVAVGLWAALKGERALWAWPVAFFSLMLTGGALGIAGVPVSPVEPVIFASIVALGLLIAAAVDLPVAAGVITIGFFAFFHGHAHGTETPENAGGLEYITGFVLATALLHAAGIGFGLLSGQRVRGLVRLAGARIAAAPGCAPELTGRSKGTRVVQLQEGVTVSSGAQGNCWP